MDPEIEKIIKERMEKLPDSIRSVLANPGLNEKIMSIGKKNGLDPEQLGILQIETYLVLLGLVHIDDYPDELKNSLKIEDLKLNGVLNDINAEILNPIREKLKEMYETDEDNEEVPENIGEILDERFDKMPEELKKIIIQSGYHAKLYEIAAESKLNVPQMGALEEATASVLTGATHPDKFEEKIKEKMTLPDEMVKKLVGDINEKILKPIREKMESTYGRPKIPTEIKPAGIRAIPITRKVDLSLPKLAAGKKETEKVPRPPQKPFPPGLVPKLTGSFQSSTFKTDYTLKREEPAVVKNEVPQKNMDPYRELPE